MTITQRAIDPADIPPARRGPHAAFWKEAVLRFVEDGWEAGEVVIKDGRTPLNAYTGVRAAIRYAGLNDTVRALKRQNRVFLVRLPARPVE